MLQAIADRMNKKYGAGTVVIAGQAKGLKPKRFSTGSLLLDIALNGGFAEGRINELVGQFSTYKTTLAIRSCREFLRKPGKRYIVWIDMEHCFDNEWVKYMGADPDQFLLIVPDSGEQAVNAAVDALKAPNGHVLLVLDSIAALVPMNEVQEDAKGIGTHPRLVSKLVKRTNALLKSDLVSGEVKRSVLFLNQARVNIGVMFGDPECLHSDSKVNFVDGPAVSIKDVVNKKLSGPIWSYDEAKKLFVPARIAKHCYNGEAKDGELLTVTSKAVGTKNGVLSATVSLTHNFLTSKGWKNARNLKRGDDLITRYEDRINGTLREFLIGTCCGDATFVKSAYKGASLRFEDSKNEDYVRWKVAKLEPYFKFRVMPNDSGSRIYYSESRTDLFVLKEAFLNCRHPAVLFREFSWLSFALWIMDAGYYGRDRYSLCIGRFKTQHKIRKYISKEFNKLGLDHFWNQCKTVVFTRAASSKIADKIRSYVPSCMQYKLPVDERTVRERKFSLVCVPQQKPINVSVMHVVPASRRKYRNRGYYDIHVRGTQTYTVGNEHNGFVVHNTAPGGRALEHFVSIRVRLRREKYIYEEIANDLKRCVGSRINFRILKNKTGGAPQETGVFTFYNTAFGYCDGGEIDNIGDILPWAVAYGVVTKKGNGYSFDGVHGNGKDAFCGKVHSSPALVRKLAKDTLNAHRAELYRKMGGKKRSSSAEEKPNVF